MDANVHRRRIGALATAGVLLGLSFAVPASAAPSIHFDLHQNACLVAGRGPAGARVVVVWKDREGELKDRSVVTVTRRGTWQSPCTYNGVAYGDTVKATIGSTSRTFQVPRFTVVTDRTTDMVRGRAPVAGSLKVRGLKYSGFRYSHDVKLTPTVDGDGTWSADFSGWMDLQGWDEVEATWTSPESDTFGRWVAVPFLFVRRGGSYVEAYARPGSDVTITLRDGSDTVRGVMQETVDIWGWVDGNFLDEHGDGTYVHTGDRIVATGIADDMDFTVPPVSVTGKPATDVVSGTCLPDRAYRFRVMRPDGTYLPSQSRGSEWWTGVANGAGAFSVNTRLTTPGGSDLRSRDRIDLQCKLPTGDLVGRFTTLP